MDKMIYELQSKHILDYLNHLVSDRARKSLQYFLKIKIKFLFQ